MADFFLLHLVAGFLGMCIQQLSSGETGEEDTSSVSNVMAWEAEDARELEMCALRGREGQELVNIKSLR
jgi:hypothetical protein